VWRVCELVVVAMGFAQSCMGNRPENSKIGQNRPSPLTTFTQAPYVKRVVCFYICSCLFITSYNTERNMYSTMAQI
jgi:hypothetical protein